MDHLGLMATASLAAPLGTQRLEVSISHAVLSLEPERPPKEHGFCALESGREGSGRWLFLGCLGGLLQVQSMDVAELRPG